MPTLPFSDSALATSDASGNITFTGFQQPRVGMWRTGSLSVVRSDGSAVVPSSVLPITWKAYVAKTIWGTWYNDQPSNLVQTAGPAVEVRGTNLAASTAYQCVFTGYDSDSPPTLSPLPAPAPPPSSPQLLLITGRTVSPADTVVTVGSAPVIVGTSVSVQASYSDASGRIELGWTTPGLFGQGIYNLLGDFTFDLGQSALLKGLVLPNLGPLLVVKAITHAASASLTLNLFTGLAPIVRPPIIPAGVLLTAQGNIGANAVVSVPFLYPYVGPAVLSVILQNSTGAAGTHGFWVDCNGLDYTGASFSWAHAIVDYVSDNNTVQAAVIEPRVIHIPPLINSIVLNSQNPNTLGYTLSIVPLGP